MGKKLTDPTITAIPSVDRAADKMYIVDVSAGTSNYVLPNNLLGFTGGNPVSTTDTQTLTNKTLASPTMTAPSITDSNSRVIDLSSSWVNGSGTWTYASVTTFTAPAADVALLQKGMHIKLTQSATVKYFDIASAVGTTVTIIANADYTLANQVISSPAFSAAASPYGFPDWFNYAATDTGYSANPATPITRYRISGRTCTVMRREASNGTSSATTTTFTAPVAAATVAGARWIAPCAAVDNGTTNTTPAAMSISSAATSIDLFKNFDLGVTLWTNSGNKRGCASGVLTYEI